MDYQIPDSPKGSVEYYFGSGRMPVERFRQTEEWRHWSNLVPCGDDWLLIHHNGGVVYLTVENGIVTGYRICEGEAAKALLIAHALRPDDKLRQWVSDRFRLGRVLMTVLDEASPTNRGNHSFLRSTANKKRLPFGMKGVLEVDVDDAGQIEQVAWLAPEQALALMEEAAADEAFDVRRYPLGTQTARTEKEAILFVASVNGRIKRRRVHNGVLQIVAATKEGTCRFDFRLTQPDQSGLGSGPSPLFGLGQLVVFARTAGRSVPKNLDQLWATHTEHHRRLRLYASLAAQEALTLIPEGGAPPPDDVFRGHVGRRAYEKHPEWFARDAVAAVATEQAARAHQWERDVPAILARSTRDIRTYVWRMGQFPDAVETAQKTWTVLGPGAATQKIRIDVHGGNPCKLGPTDIVAAVGHMVRAQPTTPEGLCATALQQVIGELKQARAVHSELRDWVEPGADRVSPSAFRPGVEPGPNACSVVALDQFQQLLDTMVGTLAGALAAREAPSAGSSDFRWPETSRLQVLRELALGVPVASAMRAVEALANVRVTPGITMDECSGRTLHWYALELKASLQPLAMLGVVVGGEGQVLGRMLLDGAAAQEQQAHLDSLAGAAGGATPSEPSASTTPSPQPAVSEPAQAVHPRPDPTPDPSPTPAPESSGSAWRIRVALGLASLAMWVLFFVNSEDFYRQIIQYSIWSSDVGSFWAVAVVVFGLQVGLFVQKASGLARLFTASTALVSLALVGFILALRIPPVSTAVLHTEMVIPLGIASPLGSARKFPRLELQQASTGRWIQRDRPLLMRLVSHSDADFHRYPQHAAVIYRGLQRHKVTIDELLKHPGGEQLLWGVLQAEGTPHIWTDLEWSKPSRSSKSSSHLHAGLLSAKQARALIKRRLKRLKPLSVDDLEATLYVMTRFPAWFSDADRSRLQSHWRTSFTAIRPHIDDAFSNLAEACAVVGRSGTLDVALRVTGGTDGSHSDLERQYQAKQMVVSFLQACGVTVRVDPSASTSATVAIQRAPLYEYEQPIYKAVPKTEYRTTQRRGANGHHTTRTEKVTTSEQVRVGSETRTRYVYSAELSLRRGGTSRRLETTPFNWEWLYFNPKTRHADPPPESVPYRSWMLGLHQHHFSRPGT